MRRDFLRQLRCGVMALSCGRTARGPARPRGALQTTREHDLAARREWLITGQWHIWSIAFQLLPAEGFALQFGRDGGVTSEHWKISKYWELTQPDDLRLYGSERGAAIRFGFNVEYQVFVCWADGPRRSLFALIGPAGTPFPRIAERLRDDPEGKTRQYAPN